MFPEMIPDQELEKTVYQKTMENRCQGSAYPSQSVTHRGYQLTDHTALEAEGTASARLSALSEYSTDDFGMVNQTNQPWSEENTPMGPTQEGKEKDRLQQASEDKTLVLGELPNRLYLA